MMLVICIAAMIAVAWMTLNIFAVGIVALISIVWFFVSQEIYKINDYQLLTNRVEKLKSFSHKLQDLIDSELALVQDDVLRTRNIVSDSIDILQAASLSIHSTIILQDSDLRALQAANMQSLRQKDASGQVSIVNTVDANKSWVDIESIASNTASLKINADRMMQALQFDDIVNQISQRVAEHIDDIQRTVNILSHLYDSEMSSTFEKDLDFMQKEYLLVKDKLSHVSAKKIAAQEDMSEGDIDIF